MMTLRIFDYSLITDSLMDMSIIGCPHFHFPMLVPGIFPPIHV